MENSSWALLALLHLAALAFFTKIVFRRQPKRNLPPGPRPWPVIGNLNLVGSIPHRSLHSLSLKYGGIMQLKFGKFPVVVASSPEMAKQFLRVHDTVFASRPALAAGKHTSYNYSNMTWAPYGPFWRQARKIYLSEVFNAKKLESLEHIRIEERRNFFARLYSLSGKPVVLREHLSRYTLSSITRMVLSSKYFSELEHDKSVVKLDELLEMFEEWFLLNGVFNIGDWIPWLSFLDLQGYVKRMKALHKKLDEFFSHVINDHETRIATGKDSGPGDVVDALFQLAEDPNLEVTLTRDRMKGLLQGLLAGGTDTAATAIEWAVHELVKNPHIIKKGKEELDRVIGRNRWVEENDFSDLPYLDIIESMRLHPLSTILAPHYAMEDCKVAGYDISKGTTILINAWSIGRDPNSWDARDEFLPERFVGKEIDLTGSNFALLPFGSGRRRCPGYNLGLKFVRTILANLLHGFNLHLVDGMRPEDICMEELYGLTAPPKEPLAIIMEPLLPKNFY
ncbi:Trimethyltridecatetraene synthase [Sesamum angolense]|uniref:Trimethyltridecatetraene synthase n=1 Tax=Sesamum angolense TaxID=2727404 RepID=A0AAE1WDC2_9LAMI|nr:Trimethyltridecatetraene synthase [Sesamum angolense]